MVSVSKNAGFCFGVRRATNTIEDLIKSKGQNDIVCTFGKLIHNEQYIDYLEKCGIRIIEKDDIGGLIEIAKQGTKVTIVTRTHGVEKSIHDVLIQNSKEIDTFELVDATCPYVRKIQEIATENSGEDCIFILIGKKDHPEVESIKSYIRGKSEIFDNSKELEQFLIHNDLSNLKVNMAAQTTQNLQEWKKCQEIIKKYYTNVKIYDTICNVTEKRQEEAKALSLQNDVMLVIGGKDSSNTSKLYQICSEYSKNAFWIQTKDDIPFDLIGSANKIGITAGASTPDSIIQEVKETMSDVMNENFEQMLKEQFESQNQKIYKGAIVKGTVMSVSELGIQLDLGVKQTGTITRDRITQDNDAKLCDMFKIGDEVEAKVESISDIDGEITLSKKAVDDIKNWDKIVEYAKTGEVVDATVIRATSGGLVTLVDGFEVFVPNSMTGLDKEADTSSLLKTVQKIKVVETKPERKRAIGSMKAVARELRKAAIEKFWNEIEEGKEYEGVVKNLTSYGAFVDIGGVDGLVHITELSWLRIKHPSEVVKVGDKIKVFVKSFDKEAKKVSLGYKTDDQNPWTVFNSTYKLGDVAECKIVGITSFGAFAQVVPGIDGLIHISEIADQKIDSIAKLLKKGDIVQAKIVSIDEEHKKVSLSMRALLPPKEEAPAEAAPVEETPVVAEEAPAEEVPVQEVPAQEEAQEEKAE